MEEKKLTDEELTKAVEFCISMKESVGYIDGYKIKVIKFADILDLIHRQKAEIERLKKREKIADKDLDDVSNEWANCREENARLKAEIERLTEENEYLDMCGKQFLADYQKCEIERAETQKQAEYWESETKIARRDIDEAVKDTAREILTEIDDLTLCIIGGSNEFEKGYFQAIADMKTAIKDLLKEKYTVEVE